MPKITPITKEQKVDAERFAREISEVLTPYLAENKILTAVIIRELSKLILKGNL